jgi:adenylate kinase family enzyme
MNAGPALCRVVVLGNGGSGKSTFARSLAQVTRLPLTELDSVFWSADLQPKPPQRWRELQTSLAQQPEWILDGDLGPYDMLDVRLTFCDAVVLFDLPTRVCAWRAVKRSRQGLDFWRWLLTWRRRCRPRILQSIAEHAPSAELFVIRRDRDLDGVLASLGVVGRS